MEVIDRVNTLAYYKMELTMTVKSFIELLPGLLTLFEMARRQKFFAIFYFMYPAKVGDCDKFYFTFSFDI